MSREIEIEIEVDFFKGIENPDDQTGDKSRIAHDAIANHSRYFKTSQLEIEREREKEQGAEEVVAAK